MHRLIILAALAGSMAHGQLTITDTIKTPMGGNWSGTVTVTLNNPGTAQPLYSGSETLSGWSQTVTVTNGAFSITLYANDAITPTGTSYTARYTPTSGSAWSETWVVPTGATTIRELRSTTVPTPRTMFTPSQITQAGAALNNVLRWNGSAWAPYASILTDPMTTTGDMIFRTGGVPARLPIGSTGQVLTVTGGAPGWATGISGNAATATALQTPRTIAGVSFDGTANISLASTNLSDSAGIVRGAAALTAAGWIPFVTAAGALTAETGFAWSTADKRLAILSAAGPNMTIRSTNAGSMAQIAFLRQSDSANRGSVGYSNTLDHIFLGSSTARVLNITQNNTVLMGTDADDGVTRLQVAGTAAAAAVRLTGQAEPAANASNEGLMVYIRGTTGVSGSLRICVQLTDGSYAWVPLF